MSSITVQVQGLTIALKQDSPDGLSSLSTPLNPQQAYQLATILFAAVADAGANMAFHAAANVVCTECQLKIARARQALAEQGAAKRKTAPVPARPVEEK
jgi:hypothetical protein